MVCVPTPADKGSKLLAETPGPVKVPPAGLPPVRAKAGSLRQTAVNPARLTTGRSCTVTAVVVLEQPVAVSVKVKVTLPAEIPVTFPPLSTLAMPGSLLIHVPPVAGLRVVVDPIQMELLPVMVTVGNGFTVTDKLTAGPPQPAIPGLQIISPDIAVPQSTVMVAVPAPEVIVAPAGTDHDHEVAEGNPPL